MSNENMPERLNTPLRNKDKTFYPLTMYNQIIMPDGVSRWDGKSAAGSGEGPINFGSGTSSAILDVNSNGILTRQNAGGNKYAIYDEGHKPSPEDIGAMRASETINADTLNGMTYEQLKEALMHEAVYQ